MSSPVQKLPPAFLKNIEEVTYLVCGSQVIEGMEEFPFRVSIQAEKHRRLSFAVKPGFLHISEKEEEQDKDIQPKNKDDENDQDSVKSTKRKEGKEDADIKSDDDEKSCGLCMCHQSIHCRPPPVPVAQPLHPSSLESSESLEDSNSTRNRLIDLWSL